MFRKALAALVMLNGISAVLAKDDHKTSNNKAYFWIGAGAGSFVLCCYIVICCALCLAAKKAVTLSYPLRLPADKGLSLESGEDARSSLSSNNAPECKVGG